ncbi:MAG: glycosyltransferase [Lutibacter sp.]|nr:MAG: glycosyltransferase [Lutibacter sp.]
MKKITVFTTTYNRAYCLHKLYESLLRQTSKDFCWLIIDDGSTDTTKSLVENWITENLIEIKYAYKKNGGMHTGYNKAYELIETELNTCIDSDDYMTDDAIEKILEFWEQNKNHNFAGIVALDATEDGKVLGEKFPKNLKSSTLEDLYNKHKVPGDKKLIYRTATVKKYPKYPVFEEERLVPLGTLYIQIDKDFELLCMNEVVCIVEYMEDGSTRNIFKQYHRSPKGFRYSRLITAKHTKYLKVKFTNLIHYISHSIYLKKFKILKNNEHPILTILAIPFGVMLYFYVKYKNK